MTAQVRSELRKLTTTRTNAGLLIAMIGLVLFGVVAGAFSSETDLSLLESQKDLIGNGAFAAVFGALIGVMAMTSEFRHGTIRATFVVTPARTRVVVAKALSATFAGAGFGGLGASLAIMAGLTMIRARGFAVALGSDDLVRLVLGTTLMSAIWGAFGVGLGAVVRNQVAAIVGLFAWVFVIEIVLLQYLPGLARYAPGAAGTALTGDTVGDSHVQLVSAPAGGLLLAAYAAMFLVAGALVTGHRDVV
jgi:ABC-2 type transport system permease protein